MATAPTCYYPDGSISTGDTPCHSPALGGGASACCNSGDICLDNHLCLSQGGSEVITRGSCTDQTWQSPKCSQYCADVNPGGGAVTFLMSFSPTLFCCSQGNSLNNTCNDATKGSTAPFPIDVGLVIYNRTSGSTSPNRLIDATVTITATATATTFASNLDSCNNTSSSPLVSSTSSSSGKEAAIGAGVGGVLGIALFLALVLLWKQKRQKQSLSEDVQTWENRYRESVMTKTNVVAEAEHQTPQLLDGWNPGGKDSPPHFAHQVQGWSPDEIDGTQIYEVANGARRG